jgi:hypothetical protein
MPSSLTIRQVCSRRPKVGQPEDLVSVLALLSFAVGNFCRHDRDFRENRGREHQRHPRAILALTKRVAPIILVAGFGAAFLGARLRAANYSTIA